ncbi:MAG: AAA family ATPase, partial [Succinivibrio sp.]|nr:AAA family ATPase [Succinivibrio sp.]
LKDSPALNENDKDTFSKLSNKNFLVTSSAQSRYYITQAIASLSLMLYKHFKKQVYVLIDEYDVPLAKAHAKGYHEKMVSLMSSFLGFLKDPKRDPEKNTSIISKVVITGCLKVAKNSIFTGVNNLYVNTVVDQETEYTGIIGFTKEETQKVLKDYEFDDFSTTVKNYYDGYKFFDKEMFCPWDVINFVRKNFNFKQTGNLDNIKPGNYWDKSSSDSALEEYLGYLTDNDNQKMQDLVDGKSISFKLNESMNYDTLSEHKSNDFWSLLLHTGYLTVDWELTKKEELAKENNKDIFVRIPNLEILECFENNILERFGKILNKDNLALNIAHALLDGNVDFVQNKLGLLLCSFVSIRDTATRAPHENYYHGFLNGIFTNCKDNLGEYHSNIESGDGYPDIILKGTDFRKVAIIEIKSAPIGSDIETLSEKAISQIEDKNYAEPLMTNKTVKSVYGYGITFAGKSCAISVKKLK